MNYIVQILRTLFFNIDRVVYEGVGNVYDLLLRISRATILDSKTISDFYSRIYALIGIFMLFKISLSLITYILNPDEFVDKEKGFASIIKRVIISLVMLVLVPYAFREAYALQAMLLEDNTLAALVFGNINNNYKIDTAGEKMKFILMYTFFQPNYNGLYESNPDSNLASCAITYEYDDDGKVVEKNHVFTLNSDCFGPLNGDLYKVEGSPYGSYWHTAEKDDLYQTYVQGIARQNFYLMFKHDIAMIEKKGESGLYLVDYMYPLSTAVGVAVLWVLLLFCIDVAVRSIKLAFYQLIAPIPILSYIDPKSKDGMFNKWLTQCGTTYASLFIRLLALYLAIYLISQVTSTGIQDVVTGERITDWWVCIFVIIGVLMFAKQLPKILEDTLGIKGTGDFTLNPLKKLEDGMLFGKTAAALGNRAVGTAKGLGTAALVGGAAFATGQGVRFGAMGRAVLGGFNGEKFGKNFASSYGAGRARKKELDKMRSEGVSAWAVRGRKIVNAFSGETKAEHQQTVSGKMETIGKTFDAITSTITSVDETAKRLKAERDGIEKAGISAFQDEVITDDQGHVTAIKTAAQKYYEALKAAGDRLDARVDAIVAGAEINDGDGGRKGGAAANVQVANLRETMENLVSQVNDEGITYVDGNGTTQQVHIDTSLGHRKQSKEAARQKGAWESSKTYQGVQDVAKYAEGGNRQ